MMNFDVKGNNAESMLHVDFSDGVGRQLAGADADLEARHGQLPLHREQQRAALGQQADQGVRRL